MNKLKESPPSVHSLAHHLCAGNMQTQLVSLVSLLSHVCFTAPVTIWIRTIILE